MIYRDLVWISLKWAILQEGELFWQLKTDFKEKIVKKSNFSSVEITDSTLHVKNTIMFSLLCIYVYNLFYFKSRFE